MLNKFRLQLDRLRSKHGLVNDCFDAAYAERILPFYVRVAEKMLGAERSSIFIIDTGKERVWLKAGTGVSERQIEVPTKDTIVGRVIASGQATSENNIAGSSTERARVEEETGFVVKDVLCVPVKSAHRDEIIGAIQVLNKRDGTGFSQADLSILEEIAYFMQSQIERDFLNQEVLGTTERLFSFTRKAFYALVGVTTVLVLAISAIFLTQVLAPMFVS